MSILDWIVFFEIISITNKVLTSLDKGFGPGELIMDEDPMRYAKKQSN